MSTPSMDPSKLPSGLLSCDFLTCVDGESDKFWCAFEDGPGMAVALWGRNGRPPQGSQRIPLHEAQERERGKLREGYKRKANPLPGLFASAPSWFKRAKASDGFKALVEARELELALATGAPAKRARAPRL